MPRRLSAVLLAVALALTVSPFAFAATKVTPGATCTKKGATSTVNGLKYTCIKSGPRLVWGKGTAVPPTKAQLAAEAALRNAQVASGQFVTIPPRLLMPLEKWSGTDLDGKPWSTSSLTGKVTVVNIWASWCGPCKEEWPVLQAAAAANPEVRFVGVNTQDQLDRAREWLASNPSDYAHVYDERGVIKSSLTTVPNYALPITVVLDRQGRVAAWITGAIRIDPLNRVLKVVK